MQKRRVIGGLAAALLLVPVLAMAQKVSYDFSKSANFASFKTYAMKDGTKVGQQLIDDRIASAIEAAMAAKGFTKAASNPDVFVVYHVAFDKEKDISTYSSGYAGGYGPYGWGWGGGMGTTTTQVRDILIGTLVIDMADAKANQLVWRGMGVKEVDTQAKPDKRDKSITNAVNKIFKNYPPKVKT
jgi:osmotically-inducible protein OsmY